MSARCSPCPAGVLAVLRMIPFERAVRGHDVVVPRSRFRARGRNGEETSPVAAPRETVERLGGPSAFR
ncbi:hypothetical protein [Streptosporangium amethystogenes]|uniref:hypothetical protein n=1 Tax=Streptosporangium amethystogenes TaxID=2002 RepID=UPI0012FCD413|nr:hypothetical protein [Streptosporangium amethystogenes]